MLRIKDLPSFARKISYIENIWVVGSSALPEATAIDNDLDILVPYSSWSITARMIPKEAVITSHGGWRFECEGIPIDIWPGDLGELASRDAFVAAWCLKTNKRIVSLKNDLSPRLSSERKKEVLDELRNNKVEPCDTKKWLEKDPGIRPAKKEPYISDRDLSRLVLYKNLQNMGDFYLDSSLKGMLDSVLGKRILLEMMKGIESEELKPEHDRIKRLAAKSKNTK